MSKMASNSSEHLEYERHSDDKTLEESEISDGSDTDDEHKILDEAFDESDGEFHKDQLREYQANQEELMDHRGHDKRTELAFLKRKWTIPELLTTCALFFEVFGWVSLHTFITSYLNSCNPSRKDVRDILREQKRDMCR